MELSLAGKTALVTGASRGIGRSIASVFAAAGANVMLSSRKMDSLKAALEDIRRSKPSGRVAASVANAGEPEQAAACVEATLKTFGRLDVLVNNAATNPYLGPLMGLDVSRAEKTARVNQLAPIIWTQLAWESWMRENGGAIINIASIGGLFYVQLRLAYYNATKAALIHLTRHMAAELAPAVRVNAIAPGAIRTDMARALLENESEVLSRMPMRRIGEPVDVANAALFLASDAASFITGETLTVDGGMLVADRDA
jgi:NAD(P)-dependent dehydrogenase (short-subunit alcohol dehydrogenase family)